VATAFEVKVETAADTLGTGGSTTSTAYKSAALALAPINNVELVETAGTRMELAPVACSSTSTLGFSDSARTGSIEFAGLLVEFGVGDGNVGVAHGLGNAESAASVATGTSCCSATSRLLLQAGLGPGLAQKAHSTTARGAVQGRLEGWAGTG